MTFNHPQGDTPFPDEFAPPKKKAKNEYGLQAAKAMFYSRNRMGYSIFSQDNVTENALIELAQGRQSTDNIRKMFGFFEPAKGATNKDSGAMAYVDIQVLNLATKYINRAVAKLQKYKYKIGLSVVDPISVNEAKEYDAKIQSYYALKEYYATMGQRAQEFFDDVQVEVLPETPEELMFNLQANQKIRKVIDGEKTIDLVTSTINDLSQIMREYDWYSVVLGHGHIHCYLDENNVPRADTINSKYWGSSYTDNEDFRKTEYQFFIEFITVNQFRKEAEDKLSKDEIDQVLRAHAWPNISSQFINLPASMVNYDGLKYIPVMRFYFLSNDHTAHAFWKNDDGVLMRDERYFQYKPDETKKRKEEIIKNVYTTVYGGSWVIDSDVVYNYGPKPMPRSNLVNTRLPIISFAPNMKEGRYVSLLSQMIEPLTMINVCHNKVKDILAKGRLGIMDVNLTAFESLSLQKGGNDWTAQDALDFLFQTNIAVNRQQTNPYGSSIGKNISFTATGVTIADYFSTMSNMIRVLDDLTGSTLAETTDLPDRLTAKTLQANVIAGNDGIEYLINAHQQVYHQVTHMLLLLTQEAKRNKAMIKGMIPALGKYTTEYFEVPDELPYCDYGLNLEREATPEEWAEFYAEIARAVEKGMLNASDSAFLREIKNMTMARYAMATREAINERKAAQMRQQEQEFQMMSAERAEQMKLERELALEQQRADNEFELTKLKGLIDEAIVEKEAILKAEMTGVSDMVRKQIERQKGVDSIIKETLRSRAERYKSENKLKGDVIKSGVDLKKAQTQKKKA
jgi:hypothetical protein